jgi:hypothetical protein
MRQVVASRPLVTGNLGSSPDSKTSTTTPEHGSGSSIIFTKIEVDIGTCTLLVTAYSMSLGILTYQVNWCH